MNRAHARPMALLLAAATGFATGGTEAPIDVTDAWLSEAPPGTGVAAAYMRIQNGADRRVTLLGARSPRFERIEMHESVLRDGMASMRRLERIDIGPGASISFAPGARHLMLFAEPPLPRAGDSVQMTLEFSDGAAVETTVPVRAHATPGN